jgi:hypothetical protein
MSSSGLRWADDGDESFLYKFFKPFTLLNPSTIITLGIRPTCLYACKKTVEKVV